MKVAILGLGTVGSGVLKVLQENQEHIQKQLGEPIEVTHIFGDKLMNIHKSDLSNIHLVQNLDELVDADIDLAIEVLGGVDFAYDVHKKFLSRGVHVVSANKDLLALHIDELTEIGNQNRAQLAYEAAAAGGIPIVHNLRYTLRANKLSQVLGILNGTTNYILTKMTNEGMDFEHALAEASAKGYAEADPTDDIDGYDAQRKITLLSRLAYDINIQLNEVDVRGIRNVEVEDIKIGLQHGYVMKLLGVSEYDGEHLEISVQPTFLPTTHQLAAVNDAMNGVFVNGNAVGETMFYGPGAGSLETASAIVADVMGVVETGFVGNLVPQEKAQITTESAAHSYYLRFKKDEDKNKQLLNELGISYKEFIGADPFTIRTTQLTSSQRDALLKRADLAAMYRMI